MSTTYKLIAEQRLSSNASSVSFNSIPQGFAHLNLVFSARLSTTATYCYLRFNGITALPSSRYLMGQGTSVFFQSSGTLPIWIPTSSYTADTFSSSNVYISDYTSSSEKSLLFETIAENNSSTINTNAAGAAFWNNTSAITGIEIIPDSSAQFVSNSSFYLYGIAKS